MDKMPTREEMEAMIEKAKREWQAKLDAMTPEERERALAAAQKAAEEDAAARQKMLEDAAKILGTEAPKPAAAKFCPYCGAAVSGGKFCGECGKPLQ